MPHHQGRLQYRGGLQQHRRRRVYRSRRHGDQHAGRFDRQRGRLFDGADHRHLPAHDRGRSLPAQRRMERHFPQTDARPGCAWRHTRHLRLRTHRAGGRTACARLRHENSVSQPQPRRGRRGKGIRRRLHRQGGIAANSRCGAADPAIHARNAALHRRKGTRTDETGRRAGQRGARRDRR